MRRVYTSESSNLTQSNITLTGNIASQDQPYYMFQQHIIKPIGTAVSMCFSRSVGRATDSNSGFYSFLVECQSSGSNPAQCMMLIHIGSWILLSGVLYEQSNSHRNVLTRQWVTVAVKHDLITKSGDNFFSNHCSPRTSPSHGTCVGIEIVIYII